MVFLDKVKIQADTRSTTIFSLGKNIELDFQNSGRLVEVSSIP